MLIIAGTVPVEDMPVTFGQVRRDGEALLVGDCRISRTQGTGAMIGAALSVSEYLRHEAPHALLAGDIGQGRGSHDLYEYLIVNVGKMAPNVLALHYWLPDMSQTKRLCGVIDSCSERPLLIADAASMYSAKAAGLAPAFDIFTPDASELAFLADPAATHPAYIKNHLIEMNGDRAPELIRAAYTNGSAPKYMIVKGKVDYVVCDGAIRDTISEPDEPAMEAVGGTGDTITGMVAALAHVGLDPDQAAGIATRANRMAGRTARVTPATKIGRIIDHFPEVFEQHMCTWSGVCIS